jgi:hypothetical protein
LRKATVMTEAAVRQRLRHEVLATASEPSEAVYEFWVPRTNARADVAVIGAAVFEGFEIKTERDTLMRLPGQMAAYARIFDRCHVVLALRHIDEAMEMLPPSWGVLVIEGDAMSSFGVVRVADTNHDVDAETLVRLLWRDEAHAALCALGAQPDPRAGRSRMWDLLLALLDLDMLKQVVRHALLYRDPTRARIPTQRFALT